MTSWGIAPAEGDVGADGTLYHLELSSRDRGARPSFGVRVERGRELRRLVPRESHATYEPAPGRPDPVSLLEGQARDRIPELVPIRHGRMLVSPFAFYRGAALVMAHDLAGTRSTGIAVQACGDAHLSNFGVFASRERVLVFDINDFDETMPGPWEWDVKRLAASLLIAGQHNGLRRGEQDAAVLAAAEGYRRAMRRLAPQGNLEVWYEHARVDDVVREVRGRVTKAGRRSIRRSVRRAYRRDHLHAFSRLVEQAGDAVRIESDPPLLVPVRDFPDAAREALVARIRRIVGAYRRSLPHDTRLLLDQYRLVDVARKVVGVGSVGTDATIGLFIGQGWHDPLFLQMKEAQPSVLDGIVGRSRFKNEGERVVAGQRCTQATGDVFLGWLRTPAIEGAPSRDYYVRQLRDWKGGIAPELMRARGLAAYGRICGETLARAHARTGDRVAIAAYLGGGPTFDRAILAFSHAYAEQNQRDYDDLGRAVAAGRLAAQLGI